MHDPLCAGARDPDDPAALGSAAASACPGGGAAGAPARAGTIDLDDTAAAVTAATFTAEASATGTAAAAAATDPAAATAATDAPAAPLTAAGTRTAALDRTWLPCRHSVLCCAGTMDVDGFNPLGSAGSQMFTMCDILSRSSGFVASTNRTQRGVVGEGDSAKRANSPTPKHGMDAARSGSSSCFDSSSSSRGSSSELSNSVGGIERARSAPASSSKAAAAAAQTASNGTRDSEGVPNASAALEPKQPGWAASRKLSAPADPLESVEAPLRPSVGALDPAIDASSEKSSCSGSSSSDDDSSCGDADDDGTSKKQPAMDPARDTASKPNQPQELAPKPKRKLSSAAKPSNPRVDVDDAVVVASDDDSTGSSPDIKHDSRDSEGVRTASASVSKAVVAATSQVPNAKRATASKAAATAWVKRPTTTEISETNIHGASVPCVARDCTPLFVFCALSAGSPSRTVLVMLQRNTGP